MLQTWNEPGNEARLRFEKIYEREKDKLRESYEMIEMSERITGKDLGIVINV